MGLSVEQANAKLASINTVDELKALLEEIDIAASGQTTVLYSGKVNGVSAISLKYPKAA